MTNKLLVVIAMLIAYMAGLELLATIIAVFILADAYLPEHWNPWKKTKEV